VTMTVAALLRHLADHDITVILNESGAPRLRGRELAQDVIDALRANKDQIGDVLRLREQVEAFERRLGDAWDAIENEGNHDLKESLNDQWITTLHAYERACDALAHAEDHVLPACSALRALQEASEVGR
jgi:hypothetical protein